MVALATRQLLAMCMWYLPTRYRCLHAGTAGLYSGTSRASGGTGDLYVGTDDLYGGARNTTGPGRYWVCPFEWYQDGRCHCECGGTSPLSSYAMSGTNMA
eukprot:2377843-Rhodomonas_salina.2